MKTAKTFAAISFFLLLATCLHAACSGATAAGTFGFTTTGTLILPTGPVPVAAVGMVSFDQDGDATGSQDRSVGGAFAHETIAGTLTVNRNCTISQLATYSTAPATWYCTSTIPGVLVDNGKHIRAVFETVTLPNGANLPSVLTIEAERILGHAQ